ncbi:MAG: hypothetical protein ACE5IE_03690 [Dehalococcoidia bacterium]
MYEDEAYPVVDIKLRLSYAGIDRYQVMLEVTNCGDRKVGEIEIYISPPHLLGGPPRLLIIDLGAGDSMELPIGSIWGIHKGLFDLDPSTEIAVKLYRQDLQFTFLRQHPLEYKFNLSQLKREHEERSKLRRP